MKPEDCSVGALAVEFARLMRLNLTGAEMAVVLQHPKEDGTCKTHDFVDANEVMLDAIAAFAPNREYEEEWNQLINAAWDLARDKNWYVPHYVTDTGYCEDCGGICMNVVRAYAEYEKQGLVFKTAQITLEQYKLMDDTESLARVQEAFQRVEREMASEGEWGKNLARELTTTNWCVQVLVDAGVDRTAAQDWAERNWLS